MTNEQVKLGFMEVYNDFWCRYKDRIPAKNSLGWDRIWNQYEGLKAKYPFLRKTLEDLMAELIARQIKRDR